MSEESLMQDCSIMVEIEEALADCDGILSNMSNPMNRRAFTMFDIALMAIQHGKSDLIAQRNRESVEEKTGEKVGIGIHPDSKFHPRWHTRGESK